MKIPGHEAPLSADHCEWCQLYHTDERYRQLVDQVDVDQVDAGTCKYRGDVVAGRRLFELGLNPERQHFECGRGLGVQGVVCVCKECNVNCPGFAIAIDEV